MVSGRVYTYNYIYIPSYFVYIIVLLYSPTKFTLKLYSLIDWLKIFLGTSRSPNKLLTTIRYLPECTLLDTSRIEVPLMLSYVVNTLSSMILSSMYHVIFTPSGDRALKVSV